jgi:hypothetical protein
LGPNPFWGAVFIAFAVLITLNAYFGSMPESIHSRHMPEPADVQLLVSWIILAIMAGVIMHFEPFDSAWIAGAFTAAFGTIVCIETRAEHAPLGPLGTGNDGALLLRWQIIVCWTLLIGASIWSIVEIAS